MKHDKEALVASWKRRSCQDLKAARIDDCNPSEWMAIVQQACDFIWQRIK